MADSMAVRSDSESEPMTLINRSLLTVVIWSAIALLCCSPSMMKASLGYSLPFLLVSGTTCTRFKYLLEVLLLRITAGLVFLISPPIEGLKLTHQTSPRFIACVSDCGFRKLKSISLSLFILGHRTIARIERVCV